MKVKMRVGIDEALENQLSRRIHYTAPSGHFNVFRDPCDLLSIDQKIRFPASKGLNKRPILDQNHNVTSQYQQFITRISHLQL
jgi:hypothetical protein